MERKMQKKKDARRICEQTETRKSKGAKVTSSKTEKAPNSKKKSATLKSRTSYTGKTYVPVKNKRSNAAGRLNSA